ncbi:MAG TPA: transcription termination/antitermination protein NusG [Clostridiales bacterium]|nr:transcription termination/antitermination protein NusG [Clostridiales bacterium]
MLEELEDFENLEEEYELDEEDIVLYEEDDFEDVQDEDEDEETQPSDDFQEEVSETVETSNSKILEQESSSSSKKAKWYVVHTYSGHENKVKANIEKIVENRGMQDLVLNVVVPTEDHVEIKNGQRKVKTRKMFPGYVLVKMIVTNESWYLVRNTQGVTGFVGHGSEPIPLTDEEIRRMGIEKTYIQLDIEPGDSVKVINGPFESFMGVVEEVNIDKQTLKVRISMFGRDTPVELEFGQVDKI